MSGRSWKSFGRFPLIRCADYLARCQAIVNNKQRQIALNSERIVIITVMLIVPAPLRAVAQQTVDRMSLPDPGGAYGVGRVSYALTDYSRSEPMSKPPGTRRKMMAVVWYPTDHKLKSGGTIASYLPGFDRVLPKLSSGDLKGMFRPSKFRGIGSLPQVPVVLAPVCLKNDSPWQELHRSYVGQLDTGACLDFAVSYRDLQAVVPRHSH
jgi:hypothetical protein